MGSGLFVVDRPASAVSVGHRPLRVALVHGSMDRHVSFAGVRRALHDVDVVTYDRRGYARSRHVPVAATLDDHVADLLAVLDGRPSVVLGHSFGGCVALRAAEVAPDVVRALAVYESPLAWMPWWPRDTGGGRALAAADPEAAAEAFLRRLLGDQRWEALPDRAKADRRAEGAALVSDMRSIRTVGGDPPVHLERVTQPVVVGRGERSAPHHIEGMGRLVDLLPDAELVVLDGATHGAHAAKPVEVAGLVRRALARVP